MAHSVGIPASLVGTRLMLVFNCLTRVQGTSTCLSRDAGSSLLRSLLDHSEMDAHSKHSGSENI